jgi:hypothetical protein
MRYVFLLADRVGPVSAAVWPLPSGDLPGAWLDAAQVVPPDSRVQAYRVADLPFWVSQALWEVELEGDVTEHRCHVSADRGRLLRKVEAWDGEASAAFAAACGFRTREHAVKLLRHDGFDDEAAQLAECADLASIATVGAELAAGLEGRARLFAGRAGGNAIAAAAPRTSITAHLTAVVAGEVGQATGATVDFDEGFIAERDWQAEWIKQRLDLPVGVA